jgi:hypothetical protein
MTFKASEKSLKVGIGDKPHLLGSDPPFPSSSRTPAAQQMAQIVNFAQQTTKTPIMTCCPIYWLSLGDRTWK